METVRVKETTSFTAKSYCPLKTYPKLHINTICVKQTTIFTAKSYCLVKTKPKPHVKDYKC